MRAFGRTPGPRSLYYGLIDGDAVPWELAPSALVGRVAQCEVMM